VIAVSCGKKVSAVHHLVLSQYTRLTDERTDGQTDRQNCNSNTVRCTCIACSRGKNVLRSMICQDRLNSLGTLAVEAHLPRTYDFDSIIELFASRKASTQSSFLQSGM